MKITIHWTVGRYIPNDTDLHSYHYLFDDKGKEYKGIYSIKDNLNTKDNIYCHHCAGLNTNNIGIAACAMYKDKNEYYPITQKQMEAIFHKCAELAIKYNIPITDEYIMTHYEVGKKVISGKIPKNRLTKDNIGKKDINYLPYLPQLNADEIGDYIRNKILYYYKKLI